MGQIVIIIIVLLAIVLAYYLIFNIQSASLFKKILIAIAVALVIGLIVAYSFKQSSFDKFVQDYQGAFIRGDHLICKYNNKDIDVNNSNFTFITGVLSFSGRNNMTGINVRIDSCYKLVPKNKANVTPDMDWNKDFFIENDYTKD